MEYMEAQMQARYDGYDAAMEAEANAFAMELLMPEKFLRADLEKMGGCDVEDDKALGRLAKKYRVTPAIMAIRIAELRHTLTPAEPLPSPHLQGDK